MKTIQIPLTRRSWRARLGSSLLPLAVALLSPTALLHGQGLNFEGVTGV